MYLCVFFTQFSMGKSLLDVSLFHSCLGVGVVLMCFLSSVFYGQVVAGCFFISFWFMCWCVTCVFSVPSFQWASRCWCVTCVFSVPSFLWASRCWCVTCVLPVCYCPQFSMGKSLLEGVLPVCYLCDTCPQSSMGKSLLVCYLCVTCVIPV